MKLGFVDAILANYTFEEVMDFAAAQGFKYVEMCAWPVRTAEDAAAIRASALERGMQESLINIFIGISHINVETLSDQDVDRIKAYSAKVGVKIASLCFYGNPMETGEGKRKWYSDHFMRMIDAAAKLDIGLITTFMGRDQFKTIDQNFADAVDLWTPIIRYAEQRGVKIAIENCPMYFDADQWPGGQNLFISPSVWRRMFAAIPSPNFGLCFDPSHMIFQHMDYIQPIYDFADKIFHVHFKDAKVLREKLNDVGIMAYPLDYTAQKLPGHGDINWGAFISALNDIKYKGGGSIEIEDRAFEDSEAQIIESLILAKRFLSQYIY